MSDPTPEQHRAGLVHELAFWREQVLRPAFTGEQQENWRGTARHFEAALQHHVGPVTRVLQIGAAVRDSVNFMAPGPLRIAVDPLADAYRSAFHLDTFGVYHVSALGEFLPFPSESFDGVISMNVLDHCWRPFTVLRECYRVLAPGGLLFVGVDVYEPEAAEGGVDEVHFWRFSVDRLRTWTGSAGLRLREEREEPGGEHEGAHWYWFMATKAPRGESAPVLGR